MTTVVSLQFKVTECSISQTTELPPTWQKFFKKGEVEKGAWHKFLIEDDCAVDWKVGVHRSAVIKKWQQLFYILQKILTCEGRYSLIYLYHIRLLMHFELGKLMKFPYFMLKRLDKMLKSVQKSQKYQIGFKICHYGLTKILVKKELENRGTIWKGFLKSFRSGNTIKRAHNKSQQEKGCKGATKSKDT